MAELVRVNTRISSKLNDWLDKESAESGLSKSSLIMMAVENYRKEKDAFAMMETVSVLTTVMDKLDKIEKQLPNGK